MIGRIALRWIAVAALLVAGAHAAPRVGSGLEGSPPYSKDPLVTAALKAYYDSDDPGSERIARSLLARTKRPDLRRVEALFLLGMALQDRKAADAERAFRESLTLLKPLIDDRDPIVKGNARSWVVWVEDALARNLGLQGRRREAVNLKSLLPPPPPNPNSTTERAGWFEYGNEGMAGIATEAIEFSCQDFRPALHELTATERERRRDAQYAADHERDEASARAALALDVALYGESHCEVARDRVRLGRVLIAASRPVEAIPVLKAALATLEPAPKNWVLTVAALQMFIDAQPVGLSHDEFIALLRRKLTVTSAGAGARSVDALAQRIDIAGALYRAGRVPEAEAAYRSVLADDADIRKTAFARTIEEGLRLDIETFVAWLAMERGDPATAATGYRAVCERRAEIAMLRVRGELATSSGAIPERAAAAKCQRARIGALRAWADAGGGTGPHDEAAALLAEAFAAAQSAIPSSSADALARSAARIVAARSSAGDLAERYEAAIKARDDAGFHAPGSDSASDKPLTREQYDRLGTINHDIALLAGQLSTAAPIYWDLRAPQPLELAELRALLGPDEALVLFVAPPGNGHGLVFAVSRDHADWDRIGMTGDELDAAIKSLRGGIDAMAYGTSDDVRAEGPGSTPFDVALAARLYTALYGGAAVQRVIARPHTLIVVPSTGALTSLPPGLLVVSPAKTDEQANPKIDWLLRHKAIAVLPSVAALRLLRDPARHRAAATTPLLAFADPNYSGRADPPPPVRNARLRRGYVGYFNQGRPFVDLLRELPRLVQTGAEGRAVAAALGARPDTVLSGMAASKAELMRRNADGRLARVRVLEFATHGLVAGEGDGIAEPSLVLAAGNAPEDWLLRASDAATLHLNADWVLLSACNTASPASNDADGLSGLARAFFYAGASALLVSHWTLPDSAAAQIVPATLRLERQRGMSRSEALRRASLAVLDSRDPDRWHPVNWAPFTLVGDPR